MADLEAAGRTLHVTNDIRAGDSSIIPIQSGECARIMTGAQLPPGAAAVVMLEDTDFTDRSPGSIAPGTIQINKKVMLGENVRHRGDDIHKGDPVIPVGTRLRAQEIGLLAMFGVNYADVYHKPRLALLSSGDELLPPGAPLQPGKIRDANSYVLGTLVENAGVEVIPLGVAEDNEADTLHRLELAVAAQVDLILSSAGVSVGAFDYVKAVIETDGKLDFWRVNMRPGKPLAFGSYQGIPFIGLPGNPVSAFVGFEVFVRPVLERLSGLASLPRQVWRARLAEAIESDGRESYLRAVISEQDGRLVARLTGHQGSGNIFSLVQANALLIVPSGVKCVPAKTEVDIWRLE
jgi:molybdopterin molybdotransferase